MKFLILLSFICSGKAMASINSYELKTNLSINKKHVSSAMVMMREGKLASITQKNNDTDEENFIEVVTTKDDQYMEDGILMRFTIGTVDKNGVKHILARPQVIAKDKQESKISLGAKNGEILELSVIAKSKI